MRARSSPAPRRRESPLEARGGGAASGSCAAGAKPAIVAGNFKCLRVGAPCVRRYQSTYRRYGFSCVNGKLRKYVKPRPAPTTTVVVTTTAPAPPPPPVYQTGHYVGTTSQFQPISFDITAGQIQNVTSGDINESCSPQTNIYGNHLSIPQYPLNADGSFDDEWSGQGTIGTFPANYHTVVAGRVQGGLASGTIKIDNSFDAYSVGYVCSSGLVTWTATLSQ